MTVSPNGFSHLSLPHSLYLGGSNNAQYLPLNLKELGSFVGCIQKVRFTNLNIPFQCPHRLAFSSGLFCFFGFSFVSAFGFNRDRWNAKHFEIYVIRYDDRKSHSNIILNDRIRRIQKIDTLQSLHLELMPDV